MILQLLKAVGEWKVHIYWMINIVKHWKARFRLWTCNRKGWATAVRLWDKHSFTWTEVIRFSPSQLLPSCIFLTALTSCIPSRASCCSSSCTPIFHLLRDAVQLCHNWLLCLCSPDTAVQAHGRDIVSMEVHCCHRNMHGDAIQHLTNTWKTWSSLPFEPWSLVILQMLEVHPI